MHFSLLFSANSKSVSEFRSPPGVVLRMEGKFCIWKRNDTLLQFRLRKLCIGCQTEEFCYHRILNKLQLVLLIGSRQFFHFCFHRRCILRCQHPVIILRRDIALQSADKPRLFLRFLCIPCPCSRRNLLKQNTIMCP